MRETQLSSRQIQAIILIFVILMGGMFAYIFTVLPSNDDLVGSQRVAVVSGIIALLAAVWFSKLLLDAVRDRQRGIERGPARMSRRFHIWFGATAALAGVTCSASAYLSAVSDGGGVWTLYHGFILWGVTQMFVGYRRKDDDSNTKAS